mmetsp:Transcript_19795/g.25648  ORF Transcript_19795/g.25648 Transcript_19795/m.25648 type:complete len:91 (-) Transcript_19795:326-598(-)
MVQRDTAHLLGSALKTFRTEPLSNPSDLAELTHALKSLQNSSNPGIARVPHKEASINAFFFARFSATKRRNKINISNYDIHKSIYLLHIQ